MDSPEQALNRVYEVAQALIRLRGAEPIVVPRTAASPNDISACQPPPQIGGLPFREATDGHAVSADSRDRIAVPLPLSPGVARLPTVVLSGALVAALSFGSGWFARSYVFPRDSSAPVMPTGARDVDFATGSRGETRTVSRELPLEGRALLDTIAGSESAYPGRDPYKVIYGGRLAETLTDHPRQYVQIVAGPNAGQKTSAAGRYQYIERSWDEASKALGLPDFSPANQDRAAFWEAQRIYRAKTGRDLVTDIQEANADPQKLTVIGRGISSWWTSLPGGIEPNRATSSFGDRFAQNLLYYRSLTRPATR
jgi:muramidase (phage lysozyme)